VRSDPTCNDRLKSFYRGDGVKSEDRDCDCGGPRWEERVGWQLLEKATHVPFGFFSLYVMRKQFLSVPEQDRPRRLIIKITIGGQLVLGRRDRRRWHHRNVETHQQTGR
jgi:hypothetical protein